MCGLTGPNTHVIYHSLSESVFTSLLLSSFHLFIAMSSQKTAVTTPYPLIDSDPHAFRVIRYFRPSDYATIAAGTAAFPAALYFWGMSKRLLH